MANKRELSQFSIWRRDSSMLFTTLNPDGGWTISTWSVSLPTILGGRDRDDVVVVTMATDT